MSLVVHGQEGVISKKIFQRKGESTIEEESRYIFYGESSQDRDRLHYVTPVYLD